MTTDEEYENCMNDAAQCDFPYQLCQLFAYIMVFHFSHNASELWEKFKLYLIEDFDLNYISYAENKALNEIENILNLHGMSLAEFHITPPIKDNIYKNQDISEKITKKVVVKFFWHFVLYAKN